MKGGQMIFTSQDRYGGSALTEEEQHQVKEEFDFEGNNAMFDKVLIPLHCS